MFLLKFHEWCYINGLFHYTVKHLNDSFYSLGFLEEFLFAYFSFSVFNNFRLYNSTISILRKPGWVSRTCKAVEFFFPYFEKDLFSVTVDLLQAMDYARKLRDGRGKGNIITVDDGEESQDQIGEDVFEVSYVRLKSRSIWTPILTA